MVVANKQNSSELIRDQLSALWSTLDINFWEKKIPVSKLNAELSNFYDNLIANICTKENLDMTGIVCVAVGGYGRRDLSPSSDLDMMFLCAPGEECKIASTVQYLLWDIGIEVQATVRTIDEALTQLKNGELRTQTSLLEARFIIGDQKLWSEWELGENRIVKSSKWKKIFIKAKLAEMGTRRSKYGGTPFFLEPNIKDAEGGLRDWHTMWWVAQASQSITNLSELSSEWMTDNEKVELQVAVNNLQTLRWGLHRLSGRKTDRLGFNEQQQIADRLYNNDEKSGQSAEELLMHDYYNSAAVVRNLCNSLCWKIADRTVWRSVRLTLSPSTWCLVNGKIAVNAKRLKNPKQLAEIFTASAHHELDSGSRRDLRRFAHSLDNSQIIKWNPCNLMQNVSDVLSELHRTNLLEKVFPEFMHLRSLVQRDAYHCYTVDVHLIQAVKECEKILHDGNETLRSIVKARRMVTDQSILIMATLFHDIGKGRGGNHEQVGVKLVTSAAERLNLSAAKIRLLQFLVRSHQIMTTLAFTRDVHDDRLISEFADTVQTTGRLALLYLLTVADLRAVGPNVYTSWKGELLRNLFERTWKFLERGGHTEEAIEELKESLIRTGKSVLKGDSAISLLKSWIESMPERYLRLVDAETISEHAKCWYQFDESQVSIFFKQETTILARVDILARDRRGVFAKLCGALSVCGLNILEVQAFTGNHGFIIDRFHCELPSTFDESDLKKLEDTLSQVIKGNWQVNDLLKDVAGLLSVNPKVEVEPVVVIDNGVSEEYTIIDIEASDVRGLLYRITQTLFDQGCNILSAKVTTIGSKVHDAFYVQNQNGDKIVSDQHLREVRLSLTELIRNK